MRASLHISLPAPLKEWVEQEVKTRGYSTASEYVRDVLRKEQEERTKVVIENHLLKALDSGPSVEVNAADWNEIRAEGNRRATILKRSRGR